MKQRATCRAQNAITRQLHPLSTLVNSPPAGVWAYGRGRQPVLESADLIKNAKLFRQWGTGSGKVEGRGGGPSIEATCHAVLPVSFVFAA